MVVAAVTSRMTPIAITPTCSHRQQNAICAATRLSISSPCTRRHPVFASRAAARTVVRPALQARNSAPCDSTAGAAAPSPAGWLAPTLLAAGAPLLLAAQALAEPLNGSVGAKQADAIAQTAKDTVVDAVQAGPPAPAPTEVLLVLSPILLYGIFSLYRTKVNPRAKLSDFAFIIAGLVIVANLVSIIVFKIRFF